MPKSPGVGVYNRDHWKVCSQVSTDILIRTSDVTPSGVAVPHADCPRGWIIHGPGGRDLGKKVSSKATGNGEHMRESEEANGPRIEKGRSWDTKHNRNGRQNPQDFTGVQ